MSFMSRSLHAPLNGRASAAFAGIPGSIPDWGVCDFSRFCQSFTSNFPFPLSFPLSFPSSSFPFLFLSGIDRTPRRAPATRARGRRPTFKSPYPDPQILPQCNISSNYPLKCLVFLSSQTSFSQNNLKHFGRILSYSRKCGKIWTVENFDLITKTPWFSAKQSLESPPGVFLKGEPNTNKKKQ